MPKKSKKPSRPPKSVASAPVRGPRTLKPAKRRLFLPGKRVKHPGPKLPAAPALLHRSMVLLWRQRKLLGGILLIYALLNIMLVRGLGATTDLTETRLLIEELFGGGQVVTGMTLFGLLVSNVGSASTDVAAAYQSFLVVVTALALVWALRHIYAEQTATRPRIRDAYYKGMYPLIPVLLVAIVLLLQLVPLLIGSTLYTTVVGNGIAATFIEQVLWFLLFLLLALWSLYMVTASLLGLVIATLPDMAPIQALRSARKLVQHRRWTVLRKILFLPLAVLVLAAVIMVPVILLVAPLAEWLFFVLSVVAFGLSITYMYTLYRELL